MYISFENHRRVDRSLDLVDMYKTGYKLEEVPEEVIKYLKDIENIKEINSRQLAALAVVTANNLFGQ